MSERSTAVAALAGAAQWCQRASPIFSGPHSESTADWMDRLIEFGLAARYPGCGVTSSRVGCTFGPWRRARWRHDRARRDCVKCGYFEVGRQPLRRFGFDDE